MLFRLLDWIKQYQLDKIKAQTEADHYQMKLLTEAMTSNTDMIKTWFSSFQTTDVPRASVMRDEDAYVAEQNEQYRQLIDDVESGRRNPFPDVTALLQGR